MTMADVLVIGIVLNGTNGIDKGKLYCTVTVTRLPGLLQALDGVQVTPAG